VEELRGKLGELRGDDAAGLRAGRLLLEYCGRRGALILCAEGLENCTERIRRAGPRR